MKALSLAYSQPEGTEAAPAASDQAAPLAVARRALQWQPRRWLRALGWPGVLAVGLLVMSAAFYFSALEPAEQHLDQVRQTALSLREQVQRAGADMQAFDRPAEQLAKFYRLFPSEKTLPDWLGKIFAAAQAQGLVLEQGEYKAMADKGGRLLRYEITLPVKGEYPQIRKFLAGLAADVPIAGLDHIQFERQKVGTSTVEAKIRLALYLEQQA